MSESPKQRKVVTVSDAQLAARCARGRVIVIDDDADFRDALCRLIVMEGYACETYPSANAYLKVLDQDIPVFPGPSVILCDVRMPGVDGLELQQRVAEKEASPLILMSGASGITEAVSAFRAGALDFLIKPFESDALLAAISKALTLCSEKLKLQERSNHLMSHAASLSQREKEVLHLVSRGHTNIEIADQLGISLRSVKRHRHSGMEKLGAKGSAELIRILAELGL